MSFYRGVSEKPVDVEHALFLMEQLWSQESLETKSLEHSVKDFIDLIPYEHQKNFQLASAYRSPNGLEHIIVKHQTKSYGMALMIMFLYEFRLNQPHTRLIKQLFQIEKNLDSPAAIIKNIEAIIKIESSHNDVKGLTITQAPDLFFVLQGTDIPPVLACFTNKTDEPSYILIDELTKDHTVYGRDATTGTAFSIPFEEFYDHVKNNLVVITIKLGDPSKKLEFQRQARLADSYPLFSNPFRA